MMLVTSGWILLAIPKSINLSEAFTMTKFAGFKSLWTIPTRRPSTDSVKIWAICVYLIEMFRKKQNKKTYGTLLER